MLAIYELVIEMKILERRLSPYEEKYGVLSEDFYEAYRTGDLARFDEYEETRVDFSRWRGIYDTWLRRNRVYSSQIENCQISEIFHFQPAS